VVEDAAFLLSPEMARAGVEFRMEVPPDLSAFADAEQIKGALLNLMKNAVQAMGQGGRLMVRGGRRGGETWVEVADTGPGIPPEVRPRLFEPFFTTRQKGSGLGLAIVQQAAEKNRGRVELASAPGRGTSFTLYLPSAASAVAAAAG